MKAHLPLLLFCVLSLGLGACTDNCKETRILRVMTPYSISLDQLRTAVKTDTPHELKRPGKLYVKGKYLFINEVKQGIHVIDNGNPANPVFVSFIAIPGNGDLAIKGNTMYADSYTDLVAIDIADPTKATEVGRVKNVFKTGQFDGAWWTASSTAGVMDSEEKIQDYKVEFVTQEISTNCEDQVGSGYYYYSDFMSLAMSSASFSQSSGRAATSNNNNNGSGQAGSMARFALQDNYLYTVSQTSLHLFDVKTPEKPADINEIQIGRNIETIFPHQRKLFIGSANGMFIFDNVIPEKPVLMSSFQHGTACDPVVVANDIAYVTLRTGTNCNGAQNQLDLVDVSNASAPRLLKTYPMTNPHGLSVDFPTLYLCEGEHGLKVFDATDKDKIDQKLLGHYPDMHAYDIVSLGKTVLVIGKDGFYQYDAVNPANLQLLSKILVKK